MMTITRTDPITNAINSLSLDVTQEQLNLWQDGELIQDVMPNLNADEREFIVSGITIGSWDNLFGEEE
jgi:hypothetical protein|tara:strand:+ start:1111 stop:1314 length:204 start_codon:yes stop_codon:yes gene_type:complete